MQDASGLLQMDSSLLIHNLHFFIFFYYILRIWKFGVLTIWWFSLAIFIYAVALGADVSFNNGCFIQMVPIGGGSTKFVLSDRWIVFTKSRKQLLHRKYLLYETGCISIVIQNVISTLYTFFLFKILVMLLK